MCSCAQRLTLFRVVNTAHVKFKSVNLRCVGRSHKLHVLKPQGVVHAARRCISAAAGVRRAYLRLVAVSSYVKVFQAYKYFLTDGQVAPKAAFVYTDEQSARSVVNSDLVIQVPPQVVSCHTGLYLYVVRYACGVRLFLQGIRVHVLQVGNGYDVGFLQVVVPIRRNVSRWVVPVVIHARRGRHADDESRHCESYIL